MTTQRQSAKDINIRQNEQCSCFGPSNQPHQYFLSKHRKKELNNQFLSHNKSQQDNSCDSIKVGLNKKSLRKARGNLIISPQHRKQGDVYQEYCSPDHAQGKEQFKEPRLRFVKQAQFKYVQPKISFNVVKSPNMESVQRRPAIHKVMSQPQIQIYCQNGRQVSESQIHFSPPPNANYQSFRPKVNFKHESPPRGQNNQEDHQIRFQIAPTPFNKSQARTQPQTTENIKSQLFLNIPQNKVSDQNDYRKQRVIKSMYREESPTNLDTKETMVKVSPDRPRKSKGKNRQTKILNQDQQLNQYESFRSRINPKKLDMNKQVVRSKITLKKTKEPRQTLKKMTDVQQIRSLVDSEQINSDDDKESVVLGRLRQYGSLVEPNLSITQSKIGHQSTAIEKSHLRTFDSHFR